MATIKPKHNKLKRLLTNYPTNLNKPFIQIAVIRSSGYKHKK